MCGERLAGLPPAPGPPLPRRRDPGPDPGPHAAPAPANPSTKRRTEYEPPPRSAEPVRAAPTPAVDRWTPPPNDPFSRGARAPVNPDDPFASAAPAGAWNTARDVPPNEAPKPKSRTVIEHPLPGPSLQVRGALFEYRAPNDAGRIHPLRAGQNRLGRQPDRDVVIDGDPKVSAEHGFISINGDQATFVDNGSTNGSVVDGTRMGAGVAALRSGSVLVLGDVRLVFVLVPSNVLHGG